jgi:hypothetical protein
LMQVGATFGVGIIWKKSASQKWRTGLLNKFSVQFT